MLRKDAQPFFANAFPQVPNNRVGLPMNNAIKNVILYVGVILLPVAILIGAKTTGQMDYSEYLSPASSTPFKDRVRDATLRFRDIDVAYAEGYRQSGPCVGGRGSGARGVYFLRTDRVADGSFAVDAPEALIYEPLPGGAMRLVGVEFIELAGDWESRNADGGPPLLDGSRLTLIGAPNRFALPAFYEMHVWVSENAPPAGFGDPNMHVTCDLLLGD
jgi:hypothetical protein